MTDKELLEMIEKIEEHDMHQAPDYLKQMIMQKAERMQFTESIEILPGVQKTRTYRNTQEQGKRSKSSVGQFLAYSIKITAAAAAALILLFSWPQYQSEMAIQETLEREQQQKQISKQSAKEDQQKQLDKQSAKEAQMKDQEQADQENSLTLTERLEKQVNDAYDQIIEFADQLFEGRTEK